MGAPIGVKLISVLTGLYGGVWLIASILWKNHPDPNLWMALGFWIGVVVVILAVGLWVLHPIAWVLTIGLYGAGLLWTTREIAMGATDRLLGLCTGLLVLGYLVAQKDRFIASAQRPPEKT